MDGVDGKFIARSNDYGGSVFFSIACYGVGYFCFRVGRIVVSGDHDAIRLQGSHDDLAVLHCEQALRWPAKAECPLMTARFQVEGKFFDSIVEDGIQVVVPQTGDRKTHVEQVSDRWIRDTLIEKNNAIHRVILGNLLDLLVIGRYEHDALSQFYGPG